MLGSPRQPTGTRGGKTALAMCAPSPAHAKYAIPLNNRASASVHPCSASVRLTFSPAAVQYAGGNLDHPGGCRFPSSAPDARCEVHNVEDLVDHKSHPAGHRRELQALRRTIRAQTPQTGVATERDPCSEADDTGIADAARSSWASRRARSTGARREAQRVGGRFVSGTGAAGAAHGTWAAASRRFRETYRCVAYQ